MKYIVIGSQLATRPYCLDFESNDERSALRDLSGEKYVNFYPLFIVSLADGTSRRITRSWSGEVYSYVTQDSAYAVVGEQTPDSYFTEEAGNDDKK